MGRKLLAVQPVDEHGAPAGSSFLAVDDVQAGPGDVVLVMQEGNGVRQLLQMGSQVPIRSLIVGIVDRVTVSASAPRKPGCAKSYSTIVIACMPEAGWRITMAI